MKKVFLAFLFFFGFIALCQTGNALADNPPVITSDPYVAEGSWPALSRDLDNPSILAKDTTVLWTFSDDFASCSGACTHSAQYKKKGSTNWQNLTVTADAAEGYATTELPVEALQNDTLYVFEFTVTDCASQTTESEKYYFKAWYEQPPAITGGPFVAGGYWPLLPTDLDFPLFIKQNVSVLWTFSDDFGTCSGACTHSAHYKKKGSTNWQDLTVTANPAEGYATADLPIETLLRNQKYVFKFTITDCAEQTTESPWYYFAYGIDADRDSVPDEEDNCQGLYNPNQLDADKDGIGDCCDQSAGCGGGCGQWPCDTVCAP